MFRNLSFLVIFFPLALFGQSLLLEENFNYPENTNLTNYGWVAHSGTGFQIQVISPGLTFSGYPPSGIGNAVEVAGGSGSREDVNRQFSEQSSGSVYSAFMVNVSDATELGSYFFHLGPTNMGTSIFRGKIFASRNATNNVAFGIAKANNTETVYSSFSFSMNTTYLIVMKYTFNSGSTTDDVVSLWINPDLSSPEPTPDLTQTDSGSDAENLIAVALRQGSDGPVLDLDGIRIGTSWESLSSSAGNLPPVISNINQNPLLPDSMDTVTISADVTDDGAVISVQLFNSIDSAPFDSTAMALTSGDTYEATIAPQSNGATVEYFVKATDDSGLTSTSQTFSYTVGGPQITPIADIQANPSAYTIVTIEGIVTLGAGVTTTGWTDAYVQDSSNAGINIYRPSTIDPDLVRGNLVRITGTVDEFQGVTEIIDYSVTVLNTGNPVPDPLELTTQQANNTDLEGTYIKIAGTVTAIEVFSDATNITVDDGSGDVLIRVWGTTGINLSDLAVNDQVIILAVMDVFSSASQLIPGYQDEIMEVGVNPGDGSGTATIDPDSVGLSEVVSEAVTIQGESLYTLATISVQVPDSWQWVGGTGNVQLSGGGFSGAIVNVQNKVITVSNTMVTDVSTGIITINQLTSPSSDEQSVFVVRTAIDGGTLTSISNSPVVIVGAGGPPITPIADIQANPSAYTTVTIEGVVTLGAGITIDTRTDAYVQDNSGSGINIFGFDPPDPLLVRGNRVQISGTVEEFGGVTEITNYSIQLISTGNPVPDPLELTTQQANNTDLEGTYIKMMGTITLIDVFSDATNITVDDGSGEVLVRVWETTGIDLSDLAVNDQVTIQAVMDVFNSASQFIPGYQDEITEVGANPGDGSGTATIQPDSVGLSEIASEAVTIQGESPYTLATVSVQVPDNWLWSGSGMDVQLSGSGFAGASVDVQNKLITVSNAMVTDVNTGTMTINQLTSSANNELSVFVVKTAIDGGTRTSISNSPRVTVGAGGPPTTPIADIQANPSAYATVTIEGIVTLGAGITITTRSDAYVQDNSGRGINIFSFDPPDPLLVRGNRVRITGTVEEFGGVTEITNYSFQLISTGNDPPEPLQLSTNDANNIALEGTYIRVKGVTTSVEPFSDATNITVDDGSGEVLIRVWGTTGINLGFLAVNDSADVTAVMDIFTNAAQLVPGYQDEIIEPGIGSAADGSGSASLSVTNAAFGDTLSEVAASLIGTTDDTIRTVQIDIPIFWDWTIDSISLNGSGFLAASEPQIDFEEGIARIVVENTNITLTDSGIVTFKNMITAPDSINSVFWIQTAGENGRLRYIASSPIVTVGGGNRYLMYDLQTNSANFPGNVTVRGVTTIGAGLLRVTSSGGTPLTTAYIQDESGRGINLFRFNVLDTTMLKRNNIVEATGTVTEFELTTELEYTSLSLLGTITPGLTPLKLTNREVNSAKWDGTLIETDGVVIDRYAAGGGTTIVLSDGNGITNVRIWDTTQLDLSNIEVNDGIIVSGVGGVFISSSNDTIYQILSVYDDQIEINPAYHPSLADVFLKVDPHPFVPDRGETIGISYNVGAVNNQAAIRIFDLGGRLVYTLLSEPATIIQRRVEWDGRNELRDLVPLGTYICHLEVVEQGTGKKKTAMAPIVVGTILKR